MVKELENRQKLRRIIYSWPSLVLIAFVTVFLAKGAVGILSIERESARKVRVLEGQNQALALRETELVDEIARLETDEGKVEAIKEKFSAVREGEYVAIIVDERQKATSTDKEKEPWYKEFWNAIMRKQ